MSLKQWASNGWLLALVFVDTNGATKPRYLTKPFEQEPDFAAASVTFRLKDLMGRPASMEK